MTRSRQKQNKLNQAANTAAVAERVANNTYQNLHRLDSLVAVVLSALIRKGVVTQDELDMEFGLLIKPTAEEATEEVTSGQP